MDETNSIRAEWVREALRQHEGALIRYAAQITGDLDLARDVVQDTFLKLCAQEPDRLKERLASWLFRVCRNRALDVRRKENRMMPLNEIELETCEGRDASPAVAAENQEAADHVLRLLATLPPNQQEVIRLKFQGGLSYKEISRVTNLTVTNVGFLIHAGIKTIRQKLASDSRLAPKPLRNVV